MTRLMDVNQTGMEFTRGWFRNRNLETFRTYVYPVWAGKPIVYLELGIFEAMSLCWMMQRVLTHPESRAVGIDPWLQTTKLDEATMEAVRQRAIHNTQAWRSRCTLIRGNSAEVLRRMVTKQGYAGITPGSVDLCMVDGGHHSLAVLDDTRLVYQLLKIGGQMICDDVENDRPKQDHVKEGLALFLREVEGKMKLEWKHHYCECYSKVI